MVVPAHQGRGVGRALGEYTPRWATAAGYRAVQFNAVVEMEEEVTSTSAGQQIIELPSA